MNTHTKNEILDTQDKQRYQRHLQLKNFGLSSQIKLKNAHVVIIGLGGLGCPVAQYFAAAGVGTLTLVDGDHIELSNLQRQPLFGEDDLGKNKAISAQKRLKNLNSAINIYTFETELDFNNVNSIFSGCDLVLDCTDNFPTRYLINDTCKRLGKPWIYGSVLGFDGQFALFYNSKDDSSTIKDTPCFRCLFPKATDVQDCNQAGVLGVLPGIIGLHQALLALQKLTDKVDSKHTFLYLFSGHDAQIRKIQLQASSSCPSCLGNIFSESDYQRSSQCLETLNHNASLKNKDYFIQAIDFAREMHNPNYELIDIRSKSEYESGNIGGSNIPLEKWTNTDQLNSNKTYIIYCQSGLRSQKLIDRLLTKHDGKLPIKIKSLVGGLNALASIEFSD